MMAPTKSRLNPLAAEFVPGGNHAAAATAAAMPAAASEASQQQEPGAAAAVLFDIMELPMEVRAAVDIHSIKTEPQPFCVLLTRSPCLGYLSVHVLLPSRSFTCCSTLAYIQV
jgi:hypothetical protein